MVQKKNVTELKVEKRYLYKFLKHAQTLEDDVKVEVNDEGLHAKVVDPAHVAMVDLNLSEEAFEEYEERDGEIGVRIPNILNFMQEFAYDDVIELKVYEDADFEDNPFINLIASKDIFTLSDTKRLLDTAGMTDPNIPDLDLDVEFEIRNEALRVMTDHVPKLTDRMTIEYGDGEVELYAEEDKNKTEMKLHEVKFMEEPDGKGAIKSVFAIDYLSDIVHAVKKSAAVTVTLGVDYPMGIETEFEDGLGEVKYLLAPRIESR